jgi:hypothetical protein
MLEGVRGQAEGTLHPAGALPLATARRCLTVTHVARETHRLTLTPDP